MAQLFISYSTHNADFARYVRGLLQDAGFDVWMDETKLSAGQSWTDTLEANIINCSAFVIIMSPEAKTSDWVRRERLLAERLHKPMFPILFSGDAWWDLANIQYEDMRAGLKATLSPRMIDSLRRAMSGETIVTPAESTGTHTPAPAPTIPQTDSRKLEAAMPAETKSGSDTEVWAKISLPTSEGLRGELPAVVPSGDVIQKGDTRASSFPIRFPTDPRTGQRLPAQAELRVASGDFVVAAPGERVEVEIPPDADSRTVIFTLEANPQGKTSGRSRLFIDLIYEQKVIAQVSVSTVLVERVTAAVPTWTLAAVGYVAPGAATTAPPINDALRGAPSPQMPTSLPEATDEEFDQRERSIPAGTASVDDAAEEPLPTYEDQDKKITREARPSAQPSAPQFGGVQRTAPVPGPAYIEPMTRLSTPKRASNTPLRLASLFAGLALVFAVVLAITRTGSPGDRTGGTLETQFALIATDSPTSQTGANDALTGQAATSAALALNTQAAATISNGSQEIAATQQAATANAATVNAQVAATTTSLAQGMTATRQAVNIFVGDWTPSDADTPLESLSIEVSGTNRVNITYSSKCPPQGGLCYTTARSYTISDVPVNPSQLVASTGNTALLIQPDRSGQQLNVSVQVGRTSTLQAFRRTFQINQPLRIATLSGQLLRLTATPAP